MVGELILYLECDNRSSVRRLERDEDLEELGKVPVDGYQVRFIGAAKTHVWVTKKPTEGRRGGRGRRKRERESKIKKNAKQCPPKLKKNALPDNV